jgi:hypothetical protein
MPETKVARMGVVVHPRSLPRMMPNSVSQMPPQSVATPGQSTGRALRSRDSASFVTARTIVGRLSATLSQKIARHPTRRRAGHLRAGPAANGRRTTAPQIPTARRRAAPLNSCTSRPSDAGKIIAAPTPWMPRAMMNANDAEAAAYISDPAA